jgi:hypothetical protein
MKEARQIFSILHLPIIPSNHKAFLINLFIFFKGEMSIPKYGESSGTLEVG